MNELIEIYKSMSLVWIFLGFIILLYGAIIILMHIHYVDEENLKKNNYLSEKIQRKLYKKFIKRLGYHLQKS